MKYKKWAVGFLVFVLAVFGFICGMNYFVDPFGYFAFRGGSYDTLGTIEVNDNNYSRFFKAEHVKNYQDEYDAYIIGGSKAGTYLADKMSEIDGYRYYNMFSTVGNFNEYYLNTKYLVENTNVKKIVLNISGGEVRRFEAEHVGDLYKVPALISGKSQAMEFIDFLLKDVTVSLEELKEKGKEKGNQTLYPEIVDGARNLEKYYLRSDENPQKFTEKYVTNKIDKHLKTLFTKPSERPYYEENLNAFKMIKKVCDENNVELMVIIAPSFIGEISEHESEDYWQFLYDIISVSDVWDFSGYNDIDLNPYNFYNEGHFFYEVYELMVDTIKGTRSYEGFGTYVTKRNAYEHIEERKNDYNKLKKEYEETGTVKLGGFDDASRIR